MLFLLCHNIQVLGDVDHPLLAIVRQCLSNVADRRPTALGILERVSQLRAEVEDDYMERDKLQMIVDLQRLTTECEELQVGDLPVIYDVLIYSCLHNMQHQYNNLSRIMPCLLRKATGVLYIDIGVYTHSLLH